MDVSVELTERAECRESWASGGIRRCLGHSTCAPMPLAQATLLHLSAAPLSWSLFAAAEFRRKAGSEVAKEVAGLLKAYQEEVDRLTQRAKYAEGAFLGVYQKL